MRRDRSLKEEQRDPLIKWARERTLAFASRGGELLPRDPGANMAGAGGGRGGGAARSRDRPPCDAQWGGAPRGEEQLWPSAPEPHAPPSEVRPTPGPAARGPRCHYQCCPCPRRNMVAVFHQALLTHLRDKVSLQKSSFPQASGFIKAIPALYSQGTFCLIRGHPI